MGSLKMPLSVPTINLSEISEHLKSSASKTLSQNSPAVKKIVSEIREACIEWGFFYVVGHGVNSELIDQLKITSKDFFHKPKDYKKAVQRQPNNYRGYFDNELTKQVQDWKEAFDYGEQYMKEVNQNGNAIELDSGRNQWPEDMPQFRSTLLEYFSEMHSMSQTLMDLIFLSLGVDPLTMRHHFNEKSDTSFCRLNFYPVNATGKNKLGVGPHSDAGVLTVLLQDDGLTSLQAEKNGEFHDVPPVKGSFVINIGDMMQVWSNGLYKAPVHRVLSNPTKQRFSVPFFFNPSYDTNVTPVPQSVTIERPCRYRAVNWGNFRQGRIKGDYADYGEEIQIHHFEIK